ncbi:protein phosphatase methylesterase 1 [Neocloeon triangulifer]|uniref:protein phosphatase methylesterase 1 n=1 Tax=Neocloeon triangulifer TaxID=2078957 RepID=UPI00286ED7B3|nr:protein phosphatase methylesterase 1 [Neocloeon triangulifer]XP_059489258.1 protein phosphatase methylesterase 1 [Neocloeon triangulifer]XP_059489259.1 protein phosphatase methylesterase 1 [Neocloeon triangulifer]
MSNLQKSVLKSRLPPTGLSYPRMASRKSRDYTPASWDLYFEKKHQVKVSDTDTFCAYTAGEVGNPILCLLHGGGFSGLTWSLFAKHVTSMVHCEVVAIDLRGHGETVTSNDDDLSADTLARDVGKVLEHLFKERTEPVLLMGHSMGGAIAVHAAHLELIANLVGVVVIDVVEGTAMDALASMQSFLRSRPSTFSSLENAIEWSVRSGQIRNCESAQVSVPGQLKSIKSGQVGVGFINEASQSTGLTGQGATTALLEEEDEELENPKDQGFQPPAPIPPKEQNEFTWRIDLRKTENYWPGWFQGLSQKFLNLPVPKMLLLAGIDRLDKELTVGQMQGKFQMQVLSHCGHTVHEDTPDKVAAIISTFLVRHKLAEPNEYFERTFPAC